MGLVLCLLLPAPQIPSMLIRPHSTFIAFRKHAQMSLLSSSTFQFLELKTLTFLLVSTYLCEGFCRMPSAFPRLWGGDSSAHMARVPSGRPADAASPIALCKSISILAPSRGAVGTMDGQLVHGQ